MVLVVEKKFLEETWWAYALGLFLLHVILWMLLGYRINPDFTFVFALSRGYKLLGLFLAAAALPFIAGRLQMRKFFWFGFVGFLLGLVAYYGLSLLGLGRNFSLLPFVAFLQVYISCVGLGVVIEFGGYVFRKLTE